jgi:ornithine cyclodeaminase
MLACLGENRYFGAKIITAFPVNHALNLLSHVGEVMLFDSKMDFLLYWLTLM